MNKEKNKESIDFSQVQRQAALGIVVNGLFFMKEIVKALIFPLIIILIKGKKAVFVYFIWGASGLFLIALLIGYLYYLRFTFYIDFDKNEFKVSKGILSRKHLTIPLEKIQLVNINQSFTQKLIKVYSVEIDTAGTDKKEAGIQSVAYDVAQALKTILTQKDFSSENQTQETQTINTEQAPFLQIDTETIIRVGLTSNYRQSIAIFLSFSIAGYQHLKDLFKVMDSDVDKMAFLLKNGLSFLPILFIFIVIGIVMLLINLIRTLLNYYHFTIHQQNDSLLLNSGLLSSKNTIVRPGKVQITTISQNYFQKIFNFSQIQIQQTNSGKEQSNSQLNQNNLTIPGCNPTERDKVLALILKQLPHKGRKYLPNFRFVNLPIVFKCIIPLIIIFFYFRYETSISNYLPWIIIYFLVSLSMIYISYRNHQLFVSEDFIIKQKGIWDVKTEVIEVHKIQAIKTYQYPWHKSLDIGHIHIYTAAGTIKFLFGNYTEIKKLANRCLYQVESTNKNWM